MEQLFIKLIKLATEIGKLTEASLYKSGSYSSLKTETVDGKYEVSISISKKDEEENDA